MAIRARPTTGPTTAPAMRPFLELDFFSSASGSESESESLELGDSVAVSESDSDSVAVPVADAVGLEFPPRGSAVETGSVAIAAGEVSVSMIAVSDECLLTVRRDGAVDGVHVPVGLAAEDVGVYRALCRELFKDGHGLADPAVAAIASISSGRLV